MLDDLRAIADDLFEQVLFGLDAPERDALRDSLDRMRANLLACPPHAPPRPPMADADPQIATDAAPKGRRANVIEARGARRRSSAAGCGSR